MAINKNTQASRRKRAPVNRRAHLIASALRKLEAVPGARYEEVLTAEEYSEAVQMMRALVSYVQGRMAAQRYKGKRPRPPSRFSWHGRSYPLRYGLFLGQVFIANKSGKCLIGSGYNVV